MQKTKNGWQNGGGGKEAVEYYITNKSVSKEKAKNKYKNLPVEEKEATREYSWNMDKNMGKSRSQKSVKEIKYYFFCAV